MRVPLSFGLFLERFARQWRLMWQGFEGCTYPPPQLHANDTDFSEPRGKYSPARFRRTADRTPAVAEVRMSFEISIADRAAQCLLSGCLSDDDRVWRKRLPDDAERAAVYERLTTLPREGGPHRLGVRASHPE